MKINIQLILTIIIIIKKENLNENITGEIENNKTTTKLFISKENIFYIKENTD